MSVRIVCDSSAVVAMLLDGGPDGQWATARLSGAELFAPTLLPFECANVMRRQELSGTVSSDQAIQAHADLLDLSVDLWPYDLVADRVWELRGNLTCYDATFVTLDRRIGRSPGLTCLVADPY